MFWVNCYFWFPLTAGSLTVWSPQWFLCRRRKDGGGRWSKGRCVVFSPKNERWKQWVCHEVALSVVLIRFFPSPYKKGCGKLVPQRIFVDLKWTHLNWCSWRFTGTHSEFCLFIFLVRKTENVQYRVGWKKWREQSSSYDSIIALPSGLSGCIQVR